MNIGIVNTASYLSNKINTNADVCSNIDGLTEDWIIQKTGIKRRYHISDSESATELAKVVAKKLLLRNGFPFVNSKDIGLVIVASFSQDYIFPPLSVYIHSYLEVNNNCQVLDINTNCTGLVTGTTIAVERMKSNPDIKYAMVIGVEVLSRFVNKSDKFTAPFFSDGASGVLLGRTNDKSGFIDSTFYTSSSVYEQVKLPRSGLIYQNGKITWNQAITYIPYIIQTLLDKQRLDINDLDFIIFHQANKVLIEYIMDKMRVPREKTYTNVEEIGNTGAASIGIALDDAISKKFIKSGDLVMLVGVGAGFNFGANLWRI